MKITKFKISRVRNSKLIYSLFISALLVSCSNEETETDEGTNLDSFKLVSAKGLTITKDNNYSKLKSVSARTKQISMKGESYKAGFNVVIHNDNKSKNQIWYFDDVGGVPGWFQIKCFNGSTSSKSRDLYITAGKSKNKNGNKATVKLEKTK